MMKKNIENKLNKRLCYTTKRSNTVKFIKPPKNHYNNWLYNIEQPVNFKMPECYYIDKTEYKELQDLFETFKIPNKICPNLVFAYLSMVIANTTAPFNSDFSKKMNEDKDDLFKTIDLIEKIISGKEELAFVTFGIKRNKNILKAPDEITIKENGFIFGSKSLEFITNILAQYKQTKDFELFMKWSKPLEDRLKHHKNNVKYWQSYYSRNIFSYIKNELSESYNELLFNYHETQIENDLINLNKNAKVLRSTYPNTKLYLLIAKMMVLANLKDNKDKEFENDKKMTNTIKKKIEPYLKNKKAKKIH